MKGYSTFLKAPHHHAQFSVISRTFFRVRVLDTETQSAYSTAPSDWAYRKEKKNP